MCSHYIIIPFIRWNIWYIELRLFIVNIEFLHIFCHAEWKNASFKPNWNMLVPGIFHPAMPHLRIDIVDSFHRYSQKLTRCKLTRCIWGIGESLHGGRRAKSIYTIWMLHSQYQPSCVHFVHLNLPRISIHIAYGRFHLFCLEIVHSFVEKHVQKINDIDDEEA